MRTTDPSKLRVPHPRAVLALQEKKQMVFEGVAEGKFAGMARFSTLRRPSSPLGARARATGAHAEATEKQRVVAIRNRLYTADLSLARRARTTAQ